MIKKLMRQYIYNNMPKRKLSNIDSIPSNKEVVANKNKQYFLMKSEPDVYSLGIYIYYINIFTYTL
jgi:hypothetical protein